jgi:hypothetical protein
MLPGLIDLAKEAGRLVNSLSSILASAVFDFLAVAQYDKWQYWQPGSPPGFDPASLN